MRERMNGMAEKRKRGRHWEESKGGKIKPVGP